MNIYLPHKWEIRWTNQCSSMLSIYQVWTDTIFIVQAMYIVALYTVSWHRSVYRSFIYFNGALWTLVNTCSSLNQSIYSPLKSNSILSSTIYYKIYTCNVNIVFPFGCDHISWFIIQVRSNTVVMWRERELP